MPVKERTASHEKSGTSRTWVTVSIVLICVLAIGLGALSVYTVLTINEQQRIAAEQAQALSQAQAQISQLQDDLDQKGTELEQKQDDLEKKQKELEKAQSDASSTIEEKDKTISEQKKAISDLNKTVDDLKKQLAAKKKQQAAAQGQTKPQAPQTQAQTQPSVSQPAGEVNTYPNQKIVALTFDDGPGPYTASLLDMLKEREVRATFFVLGTRVDAYPALIKRIDTEGHELGNHSNSHKNLKKMTTLAQIQAEMDACANKIKGLVGHLPTVMRCPGGNMDATVKEYAKQAGVPIIQWDIDTRDWESRNVNAILRTTMNSKSLGDGSIILLHDIHKTTVDAVPALIDLLKQQGYTFVTVTELLQARCDSIEAGKVYYEG